MIKNKLKDLQKINPNLKDNITNNIKYQGIKKMVNIDNMKIPEKIQKKNLPELKLTKLKTRPDTEAEIEYRGKSINNTNIQLNAKNQQNLGRKKKSHSLMKKNDLVFPKINNNNNINEYEHFDRKFPLHNNNNLPKKKNQKLGLHNANNNINNIALLQGGILKNEKNKDFEGDKNDKLFSKKETLNIQKVKSKIPKCPTNNTNNIKNIHQQKLKSIKKEPSNVINENTLNSLLHPIPGLSNISAATNNYLFQNKSLLPSTNNNKINSVNKDNNLPNSFSDISNGITSKTTTPSSSPPLSLTSTLSAQSSSSSISNELKELELMTEKLALLQNLVSTLGGISPFTGLNTHKTVDLSPEIYKNTYKNFEISITSTPSKINEGEIIKGYGYNSSMGNIRDYNEDTITVTKVILNNDEKDYFYFFGVYDGHGGKGCSFYLKDNLHKNIKEFSEQGIKLGIEKTEENFKKEEGLNENGEIKDSSGSCGIIAMIKNKKCIIANVGDSRLVVYKNGIISFVTEDHKPGSETEKKRIEAAGGTIYQTPSLFPLYQNGKEIEIPWRVLPGRLSVSRTFGDIEAKEEKFGGKKGVVVALPDITEIELNDEYNFIVLGCDGIFDVLSNEELLQCIHIVLKEKKMTEFINDEDVHELCGDFAAMIIKSALAKDSFDNVSCIVIALNLNGLLPIN